MKRSEPPAGPPAGQIVVEVGDRFPAASWTDAAGKPASLSEDRFAGRLTVLFACPDVEPARARAQLEAFESRADAFRDLDAQVMVVTWPGLGSRAASAALALRHIPLFWDERGAAFAALGWRGPAENPAWRTVILDERRRVIRLVDPCAEGTQAELALAACTDRSAHPDRLASVRHAPVLVVSDLISGTHCRRLIELWGTGTPYDGGVANVDLGRHAVRHDVKVRRDIAVPDLSAEAQELFAIFRRRLFPEVRKIFHFDISRAETLRLGCYDAAEGGRFEAHRDDSSVHVAHRRFAMSLFLNTGEYEGGAIGFPEFGPQRFAPPAGSAVVFSCSLLHRVDPVTRGRRFGLFGFFHGEVEEAMRRSRKAEFEYALVDEPGKLYSIRVKKP
jgi:predicted 2-oxoglutarate/Fe(II)-dependent dioxygenase YbiX/peroxiredoxin